MHLNDGAECRAMRTLLARHPIAVECARAVAELCRARCDIVVFEQDRAFVVASSSPAVLQPRHLFASEAALIDQDSGSTSDHESASFPTRNRTGAAVGAITVYHSVDEQAAATIAAQARILTLVIAAASEQGPEVESLTSSIMHGLRDAVIVLDSDTNIAWANRAVGSLIGRSPADLVGRPATDFLHPDDLDATLNAILRMSDGLEVYRLRIRLSRPEGTYEPVEITGIDHSDDERIGGLVLSLRSANHADELELTVQRAQRMSDAIVSGLNDGIVATDQFGAITVVNDVLREMFGCDLAQPAASFRLTDFPVRHRDGREVDLAGDEANFITDDPTIPELLIASADGSIRHVTLKRQRVVDADGQTLGAVLIFHDITEIHRSAETLRQQALHDELTALPNRRYLEQHLVASSDHDDTRQIALYFINLDGFKLVNDNHGRSIGDRLIKTAARRLERALRPGDLLVRQGGAEFFVLRADVSDIGEVLSVSEELRTTLAQPFIIDEHRFDVTASIGVSTAVSQGLDPETLLRQADIALHAAKARGRNRVERFDQQLDDNVQRQAAQRSFLRDAINDNRIEMHFQAIVNRLTSDTVGYEALARLRGTDGTIVGPQDFIAENTPSDLMFALDCAAFEQSCAAARRLADHSPDARPYVACNLSPSTLSQPKLLAVVHDTIRRHGVDPAQLCFEVTETAAFVGGAQALETLTGLHDAGFTISLDDFGTGYSSLAHLRDFPIDIVKVDRSFTIRLAEYGSERAIVAAIVTLAGKLGLGVVAEGVETEEQLDHAKQLGVDTIQGWYYAKAKPLHEVFDGFALGRRSL